MIVRFEGHHIYLLYLVVRLTSSRSTLTLLRLVFWTQAAQR